MARFGSRPSGARNLLTRKVFEDLLRHWNEPCEPGPRSKGQAALEIMFREEPAAYCKLIASVLPREIAFENVTSEMSDDQIDELLIQLRQRVVESRKDAPMLTVKAIEHEPSN